MPGLGGTLPVGLAPPGESEPSDLTPGMELPGKVACIEVPAPAAELTRGDGDAGEPGGGGSGASWGASRR